MEVEYDLVWLLDVELLSCLTSVIVDDGNSVDTLIELGDGGSALVLETPVVVVGSYAACYSDGDLTIGSSEAGEVRYGAGDLEFLRLSNRERLLDERWLGSRLGDVGIEALILNSEV